MKRMFLSLVILILFGFGLWGESIEKPEYGNILLSVWRLDADHRNITPAINATIEKTIKESWLFESVVLDLSEKNSHAKIISKGSFKYQISVESNKTLLINISENNRNIFTFKHMRPSSAKSIFYGSDFVPYLVNVTFTVNDHPVGIIGPGIRNISDSNTKFN